MLHTRHGVRRPDLAAVVFGGLILFVGAWSFLRNTLGFAMGELDGETPGPILVIAIGGAVVDRAFGGPGDDRPEAGS